MNRLSQEKSPYLLQHAQNPVDWYPWGEEAFQKAKDEDKPVFLSIGYATCHWCHVMAHESFEDDEVAKMMNEVFVNIKVDREERPDVDHTYMTICQMMTGQGGWPLTIIMTPDKEPFYVATYLSKYSRPNRVGMTDLIPAIEKEWKTNRVKILDSIDKIKIGFTKTLDLGRTKGRLSDDLVEQTFKELSRLYDPEEGGFGSAPKFPSVHNLLFLLNYYELEKSEKSLEMVHHTLKKMRLGGLWDHVGYGFHRYSTDEKWLLPHFEKMLYDQAMMLMAYTEGWKHTGDPLFRQTAYEIVDYVNQYLTSDEGIFYSAEDADSEDEEGKFYLWETDEIDSILGEAKATLFKRLYNLNEDGNFRDEATQQKTGKNIPYLSRSLYEEAKKYKITLEKLTDKAEPILKELKKEREKRVRPFIDDKILTDWNALMIAALARAGVVFGEKSFIRKAEKAGKVLRRYCCLNDEKLLHRPKGGRPEIIGMADDYAFLIWGLLELYDATFQPVFLKQALAIQKQFDKDFLDLEFGGYFFTSRQGEKILGRQKEIYDGAIPSANSVAALNLIRLARRSGFMHFENQALKLLKTFAEQIEEAPFGYTFAIHAFQIANSPLAEIVITTPSSNSNIQKAIEICRQNATLGSAILLKTREFQSDIHETSPFTENYPIKDHLMVYVCENFKCNAPVHTLPRLKMILNE